MWKIKVINTCVHTFAYLHLDIEVTDILEPSFNTALQLPTAGPSYTLKKGPSVTFS